MIPGGARYEKLYLFFSFFFFLISSLTTIEANAANKKSKAERSVAADESLKTKVCGYVHTVIAVDGFYAKIVIRSGDGSSTTLFLDGRNGVISKIVSKSFENSSESCFYFDPERKVTGVPLLFSVTGEGTRSIIGN